MAALIGAGIFWAVDNSGDEPAASDEPASEADEDPPAPTPTPEPSPEPIPEDWLIGSGYAYPIPDDWTDATEQVLAQSPPGAIDTVIVWGRQFEGSRANLIIEAGSAEGAESPEALRAPWVETLTGAARAEAVPIDGVRLDGEEAIGVELQSTNARGIEVIQRVYLVINDDTQFSIALSAAHDDRRALRAIDSVLASWRWTDEPRPGGTDGPATGETEQSDFGLRIGEEDAAHTVVIYEDFNCVHCAALEKATRDGLTELVSNGTVRVEYRPFDLLGDYSARATNAFKVVWDAAGAETAKEFHDRLFAGYPAPADVDDDWLIALAVEAGAEEDTIRQGIETRSQAGWVRAATQAARDAGVNGTPTVLLDGRPFRNGRSAEELGVNLLAAIEASADRRDPAV